MIVRIFNCNRELFDLLCSIWRPAMRWEVQLVFDNYGETS